MRQHKITPAHIPNRPTFTALKKQVHPLTWRFRKNISTQRAAQLPCLYGNLNNPSQLHFLKYFPRLKSLTIYSNQWPPQLDLTPLAHCPHLQVLEIENSQPTGGWVALQGTETFAHMGGLHSLSLVNIQIPTLDFLAHLPQLTHLALEEDPALTRITPIGQLPQLKILDLTDCQVTDISPLATLGKLASLALAGNPVKDLSPLKNLPRLREIFITLPPDEIAHWRKIFSPHVAIKYER